MGIYDKIEEIRQKPEHIRLRFVWALVAISMVFILIIWFISLTASSPQTETPATPSLELPNLVPPTNDNQSTAEGIKSGANQQNQVQNLDNNQ